MSWTIVKQRNVSYSPGSGEWVEYLAIRPCGNAFEITVLGDEPLGEPPNEWFDEDGEPLPEYRDEYGALILPQEFNGAKCVGFDGKYLLGELIADPELEPVLISDHPDSISKGLLELEWDEPSAVSDIFSAIKKILSHT